ncbi:MAG: S8 family serine peptidase [Moraxellaceae bacterium]|nr:S8 family serine peptidase [Moraxellaceae bacterium]
MKKLALLPIVVALSTPAFAASEAELSQLAQAINRYGQEITETTPKEVFVGRQYSKLAPALEKWLRNMPSKSNDEAVYKSLVSNSGNKIAVQLKVNAHNKDKVYQLLRDANISPQAAVGGSIFAVLPKQVLQNIAEQSALQFADIQSVFYASKDTFSLEQLQQHLRRAQTDDANVSRPSSDTTQTLVGEGAALTQVGLLHKKNITGKGIKVGILDFGFGGYGVLKQKGILPEPRAVRAFINGEVSTSLGGTIHGTACTEIIHQMAPDARIYLAQVGDGSGGAGSGDIMAAAQWLVDQGVDVINFSGGGHYGAHDGTNELDKMVESVVSRGVLWVNAAGNEGSEHWLGTVADNNRNGFMDVNENRRGDHLVIEACGSRCGALSIQINWDDWQTSPRRNGTVDIDAWLVRRNGDKVELVGQATQRRGQHDIAMEGLYFSNNLPQGEYALVLQANKLQADMRLHVFVKGGQLHHKNAQGSIGIPANSEAALSVGAYNVTKKEIARYSSQGSTDDLRLKPDISAPADVQNNAYASETNEGRFHGTSAAAPHMAGFAALVKQQFPSLSPVQLKQKILRNAAHSLYGNSPNSIAGVGLLDASILANETSSASTPSEPSTTEKPNGLQNLQRLLQKN